MLFESWFFGSQMSDSDTDSLEGEPMPVKRKRATTSVVSLAAEVPSTLAKSSSSYLGQVKTYHGEQPEQVSTESGTCMIGQVKFSIPGFPLAE